MAKFVSNGYIRFGAPVNAVIRGATSVDYDSESNGQDVITLVGDAGSTQGWRSVKIGVNCAVREGSDERKKILRAYQAGTQFDVYYRSGDVDYVATVTIKSAKDGSKVNNATEFNIALSGQERPFQDVA